MSTLYAKSTQTTCLICNSEFINAKKLSTHLQSVHSISSQEYTKTHLGMKSTCHICDNETRYSSFTFKKFCHEHRHIAESEGGKRGGASKSSNDNGKIVVQHVKHDKKLNVVVKQTPTIIASQEDKSHEIFDFINSSFQDAVNNDKSVLSSQELSAHVPSKNIAFDYYGLDLHSEKFFDKNAHANKQRLCEANNIQLYQFFADEWRDKQDIVKSMIKYRLGICERKVFARKCEIVSLTSKEQKDFFNRSHLSGGTMCRTSFGLKFEDEIVAAISLRIPRHQKNYDGCIEISRFATLPDCHVVGGMSKLLHAVINYARENGFKHVLTYVDKRVGKGGGYLKSGFKFIKETGIDYFYTDGNVRHNRFKFRAQPNKPEKIVAEEAGVVKIFGCGNLIFLYDVC